MRFRHAVSNAHLRPPARELEAHHAIAFRPHPHAQALRTLALQRNLNAQAICQHVGTPRPRFRWGTHRSRSTIVLAALAVLAWSARDKPGPALDVYVNVIINSQQRIRRRQRERTSAAATHSQQTTLVQAPGWIEPARMRSPSPH